MAPVLCLLDCRIYTYETVKPFRGRFPGRTRVGAVAAFSFGRRIEGRGRCLGRVQRVGWDRVPWRRKAEPETSESGPATGGACCPCR